MAHLRRSVAFAMPLAAVVGAAICGTAERVHAQDSSADIVKVDAVRSELMIQRVPVIGRLIARQAGVVAARIDGPVANVKVHVGDRVRTGDVLAVIIPDTIKARADLRAAEVERQSARIATAKAELRKNELALSRLEGLRRSESAAFNKARFEDIGQSVQKALGSLAEARAGMTEALANLHLTEIDFHNTTIRAPYPGVVTLRHTAAGAYLGVGAPVVTLINDEELEIEADVPADRLSGLAPGTVIDFELANGVRGSASVRAVVPEENPLTRTRPVRFTPALDDASLNGIPSNGYDGLAANQSVTLEVPVDRPREVLTVHKDAIIRRQGRYLVYVFADGIADARQVTLGEAIGSRFEVAAGLSEGERVVVRGNERLRPGQKVRLNGSTP